VQKKKYAGAGIPTYTELILGLPEETRESWIGGLGELLRTGHHEDIRVWPLAILPNAPMNLSGDVQKYAMRTVRKKMFAVTAELQDVVVSTSTLPTEDWVDCFAYSTMIVALHCGGYTRFLTRFLERERGVDYDDVYSALFEGNLPGLGDALDCTKRAYLEFATNDAAEVSFMNANPKTRELIERYGNKYRPGPNTAVWLMVNERIDAFYDAFARLLAERWPALATDADVADAIAFQRAIMLRPEYNPKSGKQIQAIADWPRYFSGDGAYVRGKYEIEFSDRGMGLEDADILIPNDLPTFARAACGPAFPISTFRRFFHQFDRVKVAQPQLRVLSA
jgi:putative methyltransferase